jgi:dihydroorotate dehydrogenase
MFRLTRQRAIINRLGFNNQGVDLLVERVGRARRRAVLGINIGKNADTPLEQAERDYLACLLKVYPVADYVVVNISSPNTAGLRQLQDAQRFDALLRKLGEARETLAQRHGMRRPLLVKIAPDIDHAQLTQLAQTALARGIDGLIATNTTVSRPGLEGEAFAAQTGGLSGAPLKPLADRALGSLRAALGDNFPLIGAGGVLSGADAADKRRFGADLVQIYTGLVYRGPALAGECARALANAAPA